MTDHLSPTLEHPDTDDSASPAAAPAAAPPAEGVDTKRIVKRSIMMSPAVPLLTSLFFHLGIFTVAVLVVPPLIHRVMKEVSQEEVVVPDTTLANDNDIGGIPNPGMDGDPNRQAHQDTDPNVVDAHGWASRQSDTLTQTLKGDSADSADDIAMGETKSGAKGVGGLSSVAGDGGGEMAGFGPRGGGGGIGPRSKLFGHGGNVRSIIYVCDASGSMVGQGDTVLKEELKKDINNLSPLQQFNVLIFHSTDTGSFQALSGQMLMATPKNKTAAFNFVDNLIFSEANDPIEALREAFREHPQMIFFLSHGDFNNRFNSTTSEQVLKTIDDLNRDKKVHVNTLLLLGDRDKEVKDRSEFEAVMRKIAEDNGGNFPKPFYSDDF